MIRPTLLGALAVALAACSQQPTSAPSDNASAQIASETAAPSPAGSVTSASAKDIPAAARGRWGLVAADCTSTRGDAKGLLTIDATSLKFYESVGKLSAVRERSDMRLRATFAFSGEGMDWTRDELLDIQDGGTTLIRREYGVDALPGPFKYTRC